MRFLKYALIVAAVTAVGVFILREQSSERRRCVLRAAIVSSASRSVAWLSRTQKDPFRAEIYAEYVRRLLADYKDTAKGLRSGETFRRMAALEPDRITEWKELLQAVAQEASAPCETESELELLLARFTATMSEADAFAESKSAELDRRRRSFARDLAVLCREERMISQINSVLEAGRKSCESRKAQRKAACSETEFVNMEREIRDLREKQSINRGKLERKWPPSVLGQAVCS